MITLHIKMMFKRKEIAENTSHNDTGCAIANAYCALEAVCLPLLVVGLSWLTYQGCYPYRYFRIGNRRTKWNNFTRYFALINAKNLTHCYYFRWTYGTYDRSRS